MKKTQVITLLNAFGVVASSVSSVHATIKAARIVREKEEERNFDLTKKEIVKETWKCYVPPVIITTSTVIGIFGNQKLNDKAQASLASACVILGEAYNKYKDSATEVFGDDADEKIVRNYSKHLHETDVEDGVAKSKHKIKPEDAVLGYDFFTSDLLRDDLFFETSYEVMNRAVGNLIADSYRKTVTINDFYRYLKIPPIPGGDVLGWAAGDTPQIEIYTEYIDDGLDREDIEVIFVNYHKPPYRIR